jgi:CBS domain containing-hemolysin-like protein
MKAIRRLAAFLCAAGAAIAPSLAQASFLSGDALDAAANALSWVVIVVVPLAAIGGFLYVHVLPEKIAEKNEHPHKHSIKVLCILSLFFGGLLWPFAWLWAYTKPVGYRMVYGTEKHEDYHLEMGEKARAGELDEAGLEHLHHELKSMESKGALTPKLQKLLSDIDSLKAKAAKSAPRGTA